MALRKILLLIPTEKEAEPILPYFEKEDSHYFVHSSGRCDLVISGPGSVNIAYCLGKYLHLSSYDFLLHGGVAGSYASHWKLGTVLEVVSDQFADFGVRVGNQFIPLRHRGFPMDPRIDEVMKNPQRWFPHLPAGKGATWNHLTTDPQELEVRKTYFIADIETMENAAVFYIALKYQIPFATLRAISNYVGELNRSKWELDLAIQHLCNEILAYLDHHLHPFGL